MKNCNININIENPIDLYPWFDALNDHEIIIPLRRLQCKTQSRDLKTGKILIFDSPTLIRDGKINLTLIETESEIRHVGGAKLYIENGVYSDTVEFTSQSDPTLVLGKSQCYASQKDEKLPSSPTYYN